MEVLLYRLREAMLNETDIRRIEVVEISVL